MGVEGARKVLASKTGAGRALRSNLPDAFVGNASNTTIAAGTMYPGNTADNPARTAATSTDASDPATT
ncbi:Uncharacterised protein [Mycobacteroides abscessus subsp. abscessus]|nr:Uncharacterised protein [Mycobacteroides abscessus subsp. abscessus]